MRHLEEKFRWTTDWSLKEMSKILYNKSRRTEDDEKLMREIDMEIERRKARLYAILNS